MKRGNCAVCGKKDRRACFVYVGNQWIKEYVGFCCWLKVNAVGEKG